MFTSISPIFTLLTITSTPSATSYTVNHFTSLESAQAHQRTGINCTVENIIFEGQLSESEAISEYLW